MTDDQINFYLPNFNSINVDFILNSFYMPEIFYPNVKIAGVYGCFPNSIWNSGRTITGDMVLNEDIKNTINIFNKLGTSIRYTYTNSLLEEKHLYDTYCNLTMELGNNGQNEVIINSPLLEDYIRKNYPKYKFISSTTKCITNKNNLFEELDKNYKLVVLDYRFNNNEEILNSIKDKSKIEILVDAYCNPSTCAGRPQHYEYLSKCQLDFIQADEFKCDALADNFYDNLYSNPTFITVEDLYNNYVKKGFKNFKIEGRTNNIYDVIESYIYYMIIPKYQNSVRLNILKTMSNNIFYIPSYYAEDYLNAIENINKIKGEE